jgi:hypothetical protein
MGVAAPQGVETAPFRTDAAGIDRHHSDIRRRIGRPQRADESGVAGEAAIEQRHTFDAAAIHFDIRGANVDLPELECVQVGVAAGDSGELTQPIRRRVVDNGCRSMDALAVVGLDQIADPPFSIGSRLSGRRKCAPDGPRRHTERNQPKEFSARDRSHPTSL